MDTLNVNISYRPLRIAWAINSSDWESFRQAVRYSHTMWGGRFNPIVFVDRPEEAKQIIDLFRADVVLGLGDSDEVKRFPAKFPYLINFLHLHANDLFKHPPKQRPTAEILDIHNALFHWHETAEWKRMADLGIRHFTWEADDPLADVFLAQFGGFPRKEDIGIDYLELVTQAATLVPVAIAKGDKIPADAAEFPNLASIGKFGVDRHYGIRAGWDHAGFFVGEAGNLEDLVAFWNLRAADIWVHFVDSTDPKRFELLIPKAGARIKNAVSHLAEHQQRLAIWSRPENFPAANVICPDANTNCQMHRDFFWKGGSVMPPTMTLGDASTLGILGKRGGKPSVSFSVPEKPFSSDVFFHTQHLVASVDVRRLYGDELHTFQPPYVPELNEFYSREMHFDYSRLRSEPQRIGIVIGPTDNDVALTALTANAVVGKVLELAGIEGKPSAAGLIARQVISRLGGVDGARAFKIPGVRRLIKQHGPNASFTKKTALPLIGGTPKFADHEDLFIEPRPINTKLTPADVFKYLVEKGLFRIGAELTCPSCSLKSWVPLDTLKQQHTCELCGTESDYTRQLVDLEFSYRRSGVMGLQKDVQGAIPVTLTLQQLRINMHIGSQDQIYVPSYDLAAKNKNPEHPWEVDFVIVAPEPFPRKTAVLLGECKDEGDVIDQKDIDGLRRIADALPADRFEPYIVLSRLSPFTADEIALAKSLNGPYQQRVIMLTQRELEPYHLYERTKKEFKIDGVAMRPEDFAHVTAQIYFREPSAEPPVEAAPGAEVSETTVD